MQFDTYAASPALPRQSGFLRSIKDAPRPPTPTGMPTAFESSYDLFLNPVVPIAFGIVYFAVAKTLSHLQNGKNRIPGKRWQAFIFSHNVFLAIYSGWTFLGTAPQVFGAFWRGFAEHGVAGLTHAFCDSSFAIWSSESFSKFAYLFYLSKFYVRPPLSTSLRCPCRRCADPVSSSAGDCRHGDPPPQGQEGRHAPVVPPHRRHLDHVLGLRHPGHARASLSRISLLAAAAAPPEPSR